jgi:hypothetical protein
VKCSVESLQTSLGDVKPWARLERFPLDIKFAECDPMDGIISYFARKVRGNVHEKGIVTITWKVYRERLHRGETSPISPPYSLGDPGSGPPFRSGPEPDQWVGWDFRELGVRPTHYAMLGRDMRSWVLEGSLDGVSWDEVDRRTDATELLANHTFRDPPVFCVSRST